MVGGKSAAPELLMRALYLSKINKDSLSQCLADSLDVALDEVEHAMLDPRVAKFGQGVTWTCHSWIYQTYEEIYGDEFLVFYPVVGS